MDELDLGQTIRGFAAGQKLFSRYVLKSVLGRGGMGIVWRAFDEQLDRDVALKFLPEMVAFDEQAVKDLKRETKKSQELRHHHIVQVYDFVTDQQQACIAMEYVDGPTLAAIKARKEGGFLEVDEIRDCLEQFCEALAYAHERARVVHRDLKPANLMISGKGELKVTDFGIARSVSDSVSMLTMQRGTSGTMVYMSPQQLGGEHASHLDDIYAVGATIYDLVTGKPPFFSGNVPGQVENKVPPSMTERRREFEVSGASIPTEWDETVAACLAKDPAQRPQSAGELAKRLGLVAPWYQGPVLAAAVKSQRKISAAGDRQGVGARSRRKLLISGVVVALIVTTCAFAWHYARKAEEVGITLRRSEDQAKERERKEKEEARAQAQQAERERKEKEEADRQAKVAEQDRAEREKRADADADTARSQQQVVVEQRVKEEVAKKNAKAVDLAAVTREQPYANSLGMKFVPVPGAKVLFNIWETRVGDFSAFIAATGYNATGGMRSLEGGKEWGQAARTWKDPGFSQSDEHAACGVSWEDAKAFCEWLTQKEQKMGRIGDKQNYRLPSDMEWSAAVGLEAERGTTPESKNEKVKGEYPWGTKFPPPSGAGNYGGTEVRTGSWPSDWLTIKGYRDGYPRTSPVGSFSPNRHGIYDLGGNVWEWCEDWYNERHESRTLRGASWFGRSPSTLLSSARRGDAPTLRFDDRGFRCVLVTEASD